MRNLTVGARLLLLGALGIVLVLCVGGAGLLGLRRMETALRHETRTAAHLRLQGDVDMMHDALRADVYLAIADPARVDAARAGFGEHAARMRQALDTLAADGDADLRAAVTGAGAALDGYVQAGARLIDAAAADRTAAVAGVASFEAAFERLASDLEVITSDIQAGAARSEAQGRRAAAGAFRAMAATTAIAFAVLLAAALAITRLIVVPLRQAVSVNVRLARGDLTARADAHGRDEVAAMIRSLNEMAARLREAIARITALSGTLAESSSEISAGAAETADLVVQLGAVIDQITAGAQEQAHAAQNTAEVMQEMAAAVETVSRDARTMAESGGASVAAAREGSDTIQRAIGSLDQIRGAVTAAAERVRVLDARSAEVEAIAQRVNGIADQTNLLALNAAIEAARAGEHGRGFAVVAEEVRKLADLSARSTDEIGALVQGIREGTAAVATAMDAGERLVADGTALAHDAGDALGGILHALEASHGQAERISGSAERMDGQLRSLALLVESVAGVAQESAAAAEEMAAQSAEVLAAVRRIADTSGDAGESAASVHTLNRTAQELRLAVSGFRA